MLLRLLALNDRSITHRLSYHAALPGEVAEAMLTHPERWVRHLLAESFTAAPEPRARLLDGPESDAMAVAIGPNPYRIQAPPLPDGAYERVLNHERDNVRYETVDAPSVPDHVLVPLALNPTLPADLAAGLADHEDPAVRLAVSARPELSEDERAAIDWRIEPEDRLSGLWGRLPPGRGFRRPASPGGSPTRRTPGGAPWPCGTRRRHPSSSNG
ncbi:hypothetical protein ACIQVA_08785 [Streptomyces microflavus]|uniref:hypothetical protein n=1 Tax=Streptomyces microflavus TaxID=1919 RepID=UPI003807F41B